MNSLFDFAGVKLPVPRQAASPYAWGSTLVRDIPPREIGKLRGAKPPSAEGEKMSTGQAQIVPGDVRAELRGWQTDFTLQLQKVTFQLEDMRERVEGLRDLMAPFDVKFVATVKALSETAVQLYMVVNDRSSALFGRPEPVQMEKADARRPEVQRE